jgi:hypothetical protein
VQKDPLVSDDVGAMGLGQMFPCPIAHQGPVLLIHSRTLVWIGKRGANRGQDGGRCHQGSHGNEGEPITR